MTRRLRPPIALVTLAVLIAAAGTAAAPPSVPSAPAIPLPPGSAVARFAVVVEGTATARLDFDGGSTAPCVIALNGRVDERTTYRRGAGVVMEFVRLGKGPRAPVIVRRAGRANDSSLALKVTTTRTATGSASRTDIPGAPVQICPPLSEDLSAGPECGRPQREDASAGILYDGASGILRLRLNGSALIGFAPPECPASEIADGLDSLFFGWPAPPAYDRMTLFFPPKAIFGARRVLVDGFRTSPSPRRKGPRTVNLGGIASLTVTDFGTNRLTVRLIRR